MNASGADAIAQLLHSLGHMRASLAKVVIEVRQNSQSVVSASARISPGNNDLSARTEQHACALQRTAASLKELSSTARQDTDSAKQANQLALNAAGARGQSGPWLRAWRQRGALAGAAAARQPGRARA